MPVYEVLAINKAERKPDTGKGESLSEDLQLKDPTGQAILANLWRPGRPPESTVGQKYEGEVEIDPKWGAKLKLPRKQGGGGGGFKGRAPEDRELDREKNRSIMAESALKTAVEYAGVMGAAGRLPQDFNGASVIHVAEAFYCFIDAKTRAV